MDFRQCFLGRPEVTKIVLPKTLQNFQIFFPPKGPPSIFFRSFATERMLKNPKGSSLSVFFRHCETFFQKKIFIKGSKFTNTFPF